MPNPNVPQRNALTLIELIVVIGIIGVLIMMLMPQTRSPREAARRNQCLNQLKYINLALHNYEQVHGTLPPAYTIDAQGNRLHSWRTLILPYMEEQVLYESIDLTKPWDDPANTKAQETSLDFYQCPSANLEEGQTTYLAIVGADCVFSGAEPIAWEDATDDHSTTATIVDANSRHAVHWMSPHDLPYEKFLKLILDADTNHPGTLLTGFLDGHVKGTPTDSSQDYLRALTTIAGGEKIEDGKVISQPVGEATSE